MEKRVVSEKVPDESRLQPVSHHRFTRRALLAAVPGLLAVAVLANCGDDDSTPPAATGTTAGSAATESPTSEATPTTAAPAATTTSAATPTTGVATSVASATTETSADGEWSFTDDRGITVTLPQRPTRIVAQSTSAAAMWDLGIRPVAIFGPARGAGGAPDFQVGNVDLDAVEWLGDWGEMDLEKLVSTRADLYVDLLFDDLLWYLDTEAQQKVEAIVPTIGIRAHEMSMKDSIARFEELCVALGADLNAPEILAAHEEFDEAEAELQAAIDAKPDLSVVVMSPDLTQVYVASPSHMVDLFYFKSLGLNIVQPDVDDYWHLISWEQINLYPADLILIDARVNQDGVDELDSIGVWSSLPAVQAGQVGFWYAGAPYSRQRLVPTMLELAALILDSEEDVV